jgi:quercetin dioxygenase-like cupin family protein
VTVIRRADARRVETPNAVMTTLASPSQGGAATSVWRVDMHAGQAGPLHAIDADQVWTVLSGDARVRLGEDEFVVAEGDTMVLPANAPRRVTSGGGGFAAIVTAPSTMLALALDDARPGAACAVPVGDRLQPAWVR